MTDTHGVDVSHYNVISNYDLARAAVNWVYIKATDGISLIDQYFWDSNHNRPGDHYRGFAGIPRGAYHFSEGGSVSSEVTHFVSLWKRCPTELDPMLDAEFSGVNSAYIQAWIAEFRRQSGHQRIWVYSSASLFQGPCNPSGFADNNTPLWAARYRKLGTPYVNGNSNQGWNIGWSHPLLGCYQWDDGQSLSGMGLVDADVASFPMVADVAPPIPAPQPTNIPSSSSSSNKNTKFLLLEG